MNFTINKKQKDSESYYQLINSHYLFQFFVAIITLIAVDFIWLTTIGRISLKMLEKIQGTSVTLNFWAAGVVYFALAYLVLEAKSIWQAAGLGAAAYAVYDFTSLATFKKYDWRIAIADTAWGAILFSIVWKILRLMNISKY